jgi:hypothetical protein
MRGLPCLLVLAACHPAATRGDTDAAGSTTGAAQGPATEASSGPSSSSDGTTAGDTGGTEATSEAASASEGPTSLGDSTGEPPPLEFGAARITDLNRHYPEMHGGWGPHLRGLMRASDDALWFVHDAGEDVLHNRAIHYVRRDADGDAWAPAGTQALPDGVQQNAASLIDGDVIHTWAVDVVGHALVHCTFDAPTATATGCAPVAIGGPYATPANSNYVGAARAPDPAHLVWFTTVGEAGGAGSFVYTYDYGGGYNGPVVTPLPGYNDLAYVYAAFVGPSSAMLVGQAYAGAYPEGSFGALAIEFTFGQPASFTALFVDGAPVRSGADVWIDPQSGTAHLLAETDDNRLAYYAKPAGAPWSAHAEPTMILPDTFRGRFAAPSTGELALVRGSAGDGGIEVRIAAAATLAEPIDWDLAPRVTMPVVGPGFDAPSAVYVEGTSYQDRAVGALQFAACGRYQVADGEIWHYRPEAP